MNTIIINGKNFTGKSVVISNQRITIDGENCTPDAKEIHIEVKGDLHQLIADACESISVSGVAGSVTTMSGDVKCGGVAGDVRTMSGDVRCGSVGKGVSTMSGDIEHQ